MWIILYKNKPIRAGVCDSLEGSDFTSIQERIQHLNNFKEQQALAKKSVQPVSENERIAPQPKRLLPFNAKDFIAGIEFDFIDYLQLVEYTGQCIHPNKRGFIPESNPSILTRLNIDEAEWLFLCQEFSRYFGNFASMQQSTYHYPKRCRHQAS